MFLLYLDLAQNCYNCHFVTLECRRNCLIWHMKATQVGFKNDRISCDLHCSQDHEKIRLELHMGNKIGFESFHCRVNTASEIKSLNAKSQTEALSSVLPLTLVLVGDKLPWVLVHPKNLQWVRAHQGLIMRSYFKTLRGEMNIHNEWMINVSHTVKWKLLLRVSPS